MILAAGQGKRLRPLTDNIPKPMIEVNGETMLARHIRLMKKIGFNDFVVNGAYLKEKLFAYTKSGEDFGVSIMNSPEEGEGLETAGGIINALPLFKEDTFITVNGDVVIDSDYRFLLNNPFKRSGKEHCVAHLFLTHNPAHNSKGDFSISAEGMLCRGHDYTFSGIAFYRKEAFLGREVKREPLRPYFEQWIEEGKISAELLQDRWFDVGTAERLAETDRFFREKYKS